MKIAIIDDGVNPEYYKLKHVTLNKQVNKDLSITDRAPEIKNSHGTTCAAIIEKYAKGTEIVSIKALGDHTTGNIKELIVALEWCYHNSIDIIHMSIGTTVMKDYYSMLEIINKLLGKGVHIISACNNKKIFSAPAYIPGVIRVRHHQSLRDDDFITTTNYFYNIEVLASGIHILRNFADEIKMTSVCNSYAAPVITAKVNNFLNKSNCSLHKLFNINSNKLPSAPFEINMPYAVQEVRVIGNYHCILPTFFRNNPEAKSLVFIPDEDNRPKDFINLIESQHIKIENLVYAGKMNIALREQYKKIITGFVWDENISIVINHDTSSTAPINVPIIHINGEIEALFFAYKLNALFLQESYSPRLYSHSFKSYLYGIDFIPIEICENQYLVFCQEFYRCDIFIIVGGDQSVEYDYEIELTNDKEISESGKYFVKKTDISDKTIREVYDTINNYFKD